MCVCLCFCACVCVFMYACMHVSMYICNGVYGEDLLFFTSAGTLGAVYVLFHLKTIAKLLTKLFSV